MDAQIENAIEIASNPSSDQSLKFQAIEFVNSVRADTSNWEPCFRLFTRVPQASPVVRLVSLEILCNAANSLEISTLNHLRTQLLDYLRQKYAHASHNSSEIDDGSTQNKLAQLFSYLFVSLYENDWQSFFSDILNLGGSGSDSAMVIFYLRVLVAVHEEIADAMVARGSNAVKNTLLKDLIRQRDMTRVAESWKVILGNYQQSPILTINLCLKVIGLWVSWVEITLVVNQELMVPLLQIVGETDSREGMAEASRRAIDTLTEVVTKKMPPAPKMELFAFMNLGQIIQQLVDSQPLNALRNTSSYDTDLAETTAKLVNASFSDIVKILSTDNLDEKTQSQANEQLQKFLPLALRFLSDDYDEVCSTIIPSISELLTLLRKTSSAKAASVDQAYLVAPILNAIVSKMRYHETSAWADEEEQTDEAEFQYLRKRLEIMQQSIANTDLELYINSMEKLVGATFESFRSSNNTSDWRDLDLALREMYLIGELTSKTGGIYVDGNPTGPAAKALIVMITQMIEYRIASFSHPAIQLQFMEICVRYSAFFEAERHSNTVPYVLECFVQFVHSTHVRVRNRSWYLFQRFVRHLRGQLGSVSETVIRSISDLLPIHAQVPQQKAGDEMSSDDNETTNLFTSQLYLFEAVGCLASTSSTPEAKQAELAQMVINPLFADIEARLSLPKEALDEQKILQVHHCIMALGTLARGFSDWQPGVAKPIQNQPSAVVGDQFARVAEVVLVSLESLDNSVEIRTASRFAFSRLFGVLGTRLLPDLQRWINGLLPISSNNDEMADFLRLLGQIIFAFKDKIADVLETLYMPLLQKISDGLGKVPSGTDDLLQLGELRKEFLNLILAILNTNLSHIIVSSKNQATLDPLLATCVSFAKDTSDPSTTRLVFSVFCKMCLAWGPQGSSLPGFQEFSFSTLVPLCWAIPADPEFHVGAPQFRLVLNEISALHKTMYQCFGEDYISRTREVVNATVANANVELFITELKKMDEKDFRRWFIKFLQ